MYVVSVVGGCLFSLDVFLEQDVLVIVVVRRQNCFFLRGRNRIVDTHPLRAASLVFFDAYFIYESPGFTQRYLLRVQNQGGFLDLKIIFVRG